VNVTKHGYPPEYELAVDNGKVLLGCLMCGIHTAFESGVSFDRVVDEMMVHTEMHLFEGLG
jgi:hypothetical protein